MVTYYRESGQMTPTWTAISLTVQLLLTTGLSYLYIFIMFIVPLVYFNIVFCVTFAVVLGVVLRIGQRVGRIRNKRFRFFNALLLGFFANVVQWTVYLVWMYLGHWPSIKEYTQNLQITTNSAFLQEYFDFTYGNGAYAIANIDISGNILLLIWCVEFVLLILGPLVAYFRYAPSPYGEQCQKWYPKYTIVKDFDSLSNPELFITSLKNDLMQTILDMGKGKATRYSKVHIFYLKDEETAYLTVDKVYIENKGAGKKIERPIIENVGISAGDAAVLLEEYEHKRERINVI